MRIVFFGTPAFAVPTLEALLSSSHSVVAVVTQPDRPRGRGQRIIESPVKARALAASLPILQPDTLKGDLFAAELAAFRADLGVVAAYGKILTERVLATPRLGMVNVHASLLPKYRGAAPVHRAVIAGEPETGVTIMRVVKALDAGPMLSHVLRPIGPDETSEDVERDLARLGATLLKSMLDVLAAGQQIEEPQDDARATYAARLTKADGVLDWSRPAADLHNQIRGLHPWPHAFAYVRGQRLILHRSQWIDEQAAGLPGTIVAARGDDLRVACGRGTLQLLTVQAEGARPLQARAFLSGHALSPGDRLTFRAMIAPARVAAYNILLAVSSGRADLSSALAEARASLGDERDRALASEITTGVQRRRAALDHLIVQFSKRPMEKLDAQVVEILRLSLYQLLHLTRVPAPAIVDDAVDLVRRSGKSSASGFVNAVLRAAVRQRKQLPLPPRPADAHETGAVLDYFSTTLSHPRWLAARWFERLGFEHAETWMRFNNEPAPLTLRANPFGTTRDELAEELTTAGVQTRPGRFAPDALVVEQGRPGVPASDSREGSIRPVGRFLVQDEASQLITLLAGSSSGPRILDTCASPGNKTVALAAAMVRPPGGRALLVACDRRTRRMDLLRRTIAAAGATDVSLVQADLSGPLPFRTRFDLVFVDVPCSGLGTLRRDPDIRWRRSEADLSVLAAAERRMLAHAAEMVRSGGRLVYATCSSEPEENEQVVNALLAADPRFASVDARSVHPSIPPAVVDDRGHLRISPHEHGLEAFFGAVLERTSD